MLKDANAATALRNALDVNCDAFFRFVFDTKNVLAAVSPLLKPEMEQLAAKIRALIVETTGCVAFAGKLDLSAIPGKLADKLMEAIVRHIADEIPTRKTMNLAELTQGDVNAIYDLFANPKNAAALDRAMGKVATDFVKFQKEVGAAVQDLVDKVFNLKALKVKGVVTSPYANMTPAAIKANLDKLDLGEILDDANVNPNRKLAYGADEIEKFCNILNVKAKYRQELRDMWADLTSRVTKEKISDKENDEIVDFCYKIAEKVTDILYTSCRHAINDVVEYEDKERIEETTMKTETVDKKTVTYEYKEWEQRIWSLPEVISRVVDSATRGFFDKVSLGKSIGYGKAMQVMDKIENGKDYPQGHKTTAA